jgi:hypothetical protein
MKTTRKEPTKLERMLEEKLMWEAVEDVLAGIDDEAFVRDIADAARGSEGEAVW